MNNKTAKEIYFNNFGNFMTMKRNGEYHDYIKKKVSGEIEYQWSIEIKNNLIDDIITKGEFFKIVPLSRINLPEYEIIGAFNLLSVQCPKAKIKETLNKLQKLIPPNIYEQLIAVL